MDHSFEFIPVFWASFLAMILVFGMLLWMRIRASDPIDDVKDQASWLLFGLLLLAVFGLGAFVMYALVHFG